MPFLMPRRWAWLLTAALLLAWSPGAVQAETELRMNHQFTAGNLGARVDAHFAETVSRLTDGELTIKIYWANALGRPKENLSLLRDGALDMAAMSAGYFPDELPLLSAPNSMPMAMDGPRQASEIMKRMVEELPALMAEAEANGVRPLFFHALTPYRLQSREPIVNLADLEGKKVRVWGAYLPALFQAAGAAPVTMLLPEVYEGLQRGVVDVVPFNPEFALNYRTYEVAPHFTEVIVWAGPGWGVWISTAAWRELSEAHQAALLAAAEDARLHELTLLAEEEAAARALLAERGVVFHPFPETELAAWRERAPDFMAQFVETMETRGEGEAARRMAALWRALRDEIPERP